MTFDSVCLSVCLGKTIGKKDNIWERERERATHLYMDHFWPGTRPEPSNLLRLSPLLCCAESAPDVAAESLQTEQGFYKSIQEEGSEREGGEDRKQRRGGLWKQKEKGEISNKTSTHWLMSVRHIESEQMMFTCSTCNNRRNMHRHNVFTSSLSKQNSQHCPLICSPVLAQSTLYIIQPLITTAAMSVGSLTIDEFVNFRHQTNHSRNNTGWWKLLTRW